MTCERRLTNLNINCDLCLANNSTKSNLFRCVLVVVLFPSMKDLRLANNFTKSFLVGDKSGCFPSKKALQNRGTADKQKYGWGQWMFK